MDSNLLNIIETDIYRLSKIEAYELAKQFRLKVPPNPSQITVNELRHLLAQIKELCKEAQDDQELQVALAEILVDNTLSPANQIKFPKLVQFQSLLEPFYDCPENVYVNKSSSSTSNLYQNIENQQTQDKLLTDRKLFSSNSDHSSLDSNYEDPKELKSKSEFQLKPPVFKENSSSVSIQQDRINMAQNVEQIPLIKPINFAGNSFEDVGEFLARFDIASKCNKWSDPTKIALLPCYLTSYASKWFSDYNQENQGVDFDTIVSELKKAFGSPTHKIELQETLDSRVQNSQETPLQYFYVIKNLCKKIDPAMREDQIINYTTKGLQPSYFDALLYLDHTNLNEFQNNLAKLESKLILKKQNSRIHNCQTTSENSLLTLETQTSSNNSTKSVQFQESSSQHLVNAITELNNKLSKFEIGPRRYSGSNERAHSSRREASPYGDDSTNNTFHRNRSFSRSPDTNRFRNSSRSRERHASNPHFNKKYNSNYRARNYYQPQRSERRRYNCEICSMDNHYTRDCAFNSKSKSFRGRSKFQNSFNRNPTRESNSVSPKRHNTPKNA